MAPAIPGLECIGKCLGGDRKSFEQPKMQVS